MGKNQRNRKKEVGLCLCWSTHHCFHGLCRRLHNSEGGLVLNPRRSCRHCLRNIEGGVWGPCPGPALLLSPPSLGFRGRSDPGSASLLSPPSSEHRGRPAPQCSGRVPDTQRENPPAFACKIQELFPTSTHSNIFCIPRVCICSSSRSISWPKA
jgi:hypothetical protein